MSELIVVLLLASVANASHSNASVGRACADRLITDRHVAFARDENQRLQPITMREGEILESHVREQHDNWDYPRESFVVPLRIIYDTTVSHFEPEISWLPPDLREVLARGGRFETTNAPEPSSPYALWMIAPPAGSLRRGRTGVLVRGRRPVVVHEPVRGAEYLIELKGAGLPTGGYASSDVYAALQGGLWERQAQIEFDRLDRLSDVNEVRGLGYQSFNGKFGPQDLLFRLTPGNLRASFRGPRALERGAAAADAMIKAAGRQIGHLLARNFFAYSHPENLVINVNGDAAWMTDMLDVLPLLELPRTIEGEFTSEADALLQSLRIVTLFSAYEERHWPEYWRAVLDALVASDAIDPLRARSIAEAATPEDATLGLLEAGFAARLFHQRLARGYDPMADENIARSLVAPCTSASREHGQTVLNFLKRAPVDALDPVAAYAYSERLAEVECFARGDVTFREWLSMRFTSLLITISSRLDLARGLGQSGVQSMTFVQSLTQDAFPAWVVVKLHIEREHRLLNAALVSDPDDVELRRNREALDRMIKWYDRTTPDQLIDLMCTDPGRLKRRLVLPYHRAPQGGQSSVGAV